MRRDTRPKRTWILRGLAAVVLAATFGYGPYYLYAQSGFARYLQLRRDLAATEARNANLRAENERLFREAEALRTARARGKRGPCRSGLGRPGEIIFELGRGP